MRDGTGKHRTRGVGGASDTAFVKDRSISFNIEERLYRERGYLPAFDQLPWHGIESEPAQKQAGSLL
jgi:hypothetical protein